MTLDPTRAPAPPSDAATLVVVRGASRGAAGIEVFCVERSKVGFMGGAVVFPGGKLDAGDSDPSFIPHSTPPRARAARMAGDEATARGLVIAACREALEEAAILPLAGTAPSHDTLLAWRASLREKPPPKSLLERVSGAGCKLDLGALVPLARWITPVSERRRFDTRFFVFVAGAALEGRHDGHETTASFWASPGELLARFAREELQLAPPTERVLALLAAARSPEDAVTVAERACLDPVCPELVAHGDTMALALPGDPAHSVREVRVPGPSRYALRGGRFVPEDPPR